MILDVNLMNLLLRILDTKNLLQVLDYFQSIFILEISKIEKNIEIMVLLKCVSL